MKAMVLREIGRPLSLEELPIPPIQTNEVLIKVEACALCRTDLHIIDGELKPPHLPLICGHQVVGDVVECGANVLNVKVGDRVGVPWLAKTCNECLYCNKELENLCVRAEFTGYSRNGGFAEYMTADADYAFPLPKNISAEKLAPLLCAGMVGFRALRLAKDFGKIGFYGFGASAHILAQVVTHSNGKVFAFLREKDREKETFAKKCGAVWVGTSSELPPEPLDSAILFAPVGDLFPKALQAVRKGGIVISAGIHMSDIPSFPYRLLWEERSMQSLANLTRQDGDDFLKLALRIPIQTETIPYPLEKLNDAIRDHREGKLQGSAVIIF